MDHYSSLLLEWTDVGRNQKPEISALERACWHLRSQQWLDAESCLLHQAGSQHDADYMTHWLLAYVYCLQRQYKKAESILELLDDVEEEKAFPLDYLKLQCMIHDRTSNITKDHLGDKLQIKSVPNYPFAWLMFVDRCFIEGMDDLSWNAFESKVGIDGIEIAFRKAIYLNESGQKRQALEFLLPYFQRCPGHFATARYVLALAMQLKAASIVLPLTRKVIEVYGEQPEFLQTVTELKLFQRDPSLARRSSCLTRLWQVTRQNNYGNVPNHLTSFEQNGLVAWFEYLLPSVFEFSDQSSVAMVQDQIGNLICQFSSIESSRASHLGADFFKVFSAHPPKQVSKPIGVLRRRKRDRPLKVGWMSGDFNPHPVSRFLLSFLENSVGLNLGFSLQHCLIGSHGVSSPDLVQRFKGLDNTYFIDASSGSIEDRSQLVHEQKCDVLVDLSGWTGGHFQQGLSGRLAPVQLNYLGYFASTFNPAVDGWVGDQYLFPETILEPCTETIHRLSRCFIAWKPSEYFPESRASIDDASGSVGEIRFGSFNHNRKLSDKTLRVWGRLLECISGARLVLKANSSYDRGTSDLLKRRMLKQGLDPEKVIWLPLTKTTEEHLKQYRHIDIALDSFPNGGCTTTCEALWMGVPTVTLTGRSYVSRMSTAVLNGAMMDDWCASSEHEYLSIAMNQASNLRWLRANRGHWRELLEQNPLGDAANLMTHLAQLFYDLHSRSLESNY